MESQDVAISGGYKVSLREVAGTLYEIHSAGNGQTSVRLLITTISFYLVLSFIGKESGITFARARVKILLILAARDIMKLTLGANMC